VFEQDDDEDQQVAIPGEKAWKIGHTCSTVIQLPRIRSTKPSASLPLDWKSRSTSLPLPPGEGRGEGPGEGRGEGYRSQRPTGIPTVLGLAILFVVGLFPYADSFFQDFMDERLYTDSAILMRRTGDWLTPRWPDGTPRLQKPILTYWLTTSSYALLGTGPLTSRIPFMLVGALIIVVTYRMTLSLTGDRRRAVLAATITFSQHQLALGSIRSIPDVVLTLCML